MKCYVKISNLLNICKCIVTSNYKILVQVNNMRVGGIIYRQLNISI